MRLSLALDQPPVAVPDVGGALYEHRIAEGVGAVARRGRPVGRGSPRGRVRVDGARRRVEVSQVLQQARQVAVPVRLQRLPELLDLVARGRRGEGRGGRSEQQGERERKKRDACHGRDSSALGAEPSPCPGAPRPARRGAGASRRREPRPRASPPRPPGARRARSTCTTRSMACATCRQRTGQLIPAPPSSAQEASRTRAPSASLAWIVERLPPCPVLSACSRSLASAPRTSPRITRSGRWRSECRTRSWMVTPPASPRASKRRQLGAVICSSSVSSMTSRRSSAGMRPARACSRVVLPAPVPPATSTLRRRSRQSAASSSTSWGSEPQLHEVPGGVLAPPEAPDGDGRRGGGRGQRDGDARAVGEPRVDQRVGRVRLQPQRPRDMHGGGAQRPLVEVGRLDALEAPLPLQPARAGPVEHQFADGGVFEGGPHGFGQEGHDAFEGGHAARVPRRAASRQAGPHARPRSRAARATGTRA